MFRLLDPRLSHNCQGFSRREFLRIGGLALGGLSLSGLLAARAGGAEASRPLVTGKSVVFLFLQGGPPQIEFFDPKMTAPEEYRSITGEVQTKLAGITFGGTFPKLAAMTDKIAVVRSFASGNADHQNLLSVGAGNPMKATMGTLYSRVVGAFDNKTGLPNNVTVTPEVVSPGLKLGQNFETKALPQLSSAGEMGAAWAAFDPSSGGEFQKNLELKLAPERFDDRRGLLNELDGLKRQLEKTRDLESVDAYQRQAYDVILRGIANAFDLSREDPKTVARYDTSTLFKQEDLQKYYDMKRVSNQLGKQMLLARRLCEAGVGYVTVSDSGWDFHANNNSPKKMAGIHPMGGQVDHAVSAFLEDVHERGLSDKILLVVTGEMGRTPKINKDGGRDHWGNLTSLLLAGGGLKMGQVIGASDKTAGNPATQKYTPANLLATIMQTLFDVGQVRVADGVPRNVLAAVTDGKPISELI